MNKKRDNLSSKDKNSVQAKLAPLEIEVLEGQIDINEYLQPEQLELTNYNNEIKVTHRKNLKRFKQMQNKKHIDESDEIEKIINSKEFIKSMNDYFNSKEYQRQCEEVEKKLKEYGF